MIDGNAFLKRMLVAAAVSVLSMGTYAHGGGGKGTGGSSGGGSASSGSSSSGGHSVGASSHRATASKGSRAAHDPPNFSQSPNQTFQHVRVYRIFEQRPSTGYTTQYREANNDDWRRKHQRLFLGFIRC
jgi:hypothetical protein